MPAFRFIQRALRGASQPITCAATSQLPPTAATASESFSHPPNPATDGVTSSNTAAEEAALTAAAEAEATEDAEDAADAAADAQLSALGRSQASLEALRAAMEAITRTGGADADPIDRLEAMEAAQELVEDYVRFAARLREGNHPTPSISSICLKFPPSAPHALHIICIRIF